jgi:hypothetical protein
VTFVSWTGAEASSFSLRVCCMYLAWPVLCSHPAPQLRTLPFKTVRFVGPNVVVAAGWELSPEVFVKKGAAWCVRAAHTQE